MNTEVEKYKQEYFREYPLTSSNKDTNDILAYLDLRGEKLRSLTEDMFKSNNRIKTQVYFRVREKTNKQKRSRTLHIKV